MKKIGTFLITTALILTTFAGCGSKEVESVVSTATSIAEEMNETNTSIAEKLDETSVPEKTDLSEYEAVEEPETEEIPEVVKTEEEIPDVEESVKVSPMTEEERAEVEEAAELAKNDSFPKVDSDLYHESLKGLSEWDMQWYSSSKGMDMWLIDYIEKHPESRDYTFYEYFGDTFNLSKYCREFDSINNEAYDVNLGYIHDNMYAYYTEYYAQWDDDGNYVGEYKDLEDYDEISRKMDLYDYEIFKKYMTWIS